MQVLKTKMKKDVKKSYKKGDLNLCPPKQPQTKMDDYCNKNFNTEPEENEDCKDPEQFCIICCDNEFGQFTTEDRVKCLK